MNRRELYKFAGLLLAAVMIFVWPVFQGRVISANDIAYLYSPFNNAAPAGFEGAHNYLLADQPYQFYVYKAFLLENVKNGVWPLWNPYVLCGQSFAANIQAQAFHPLTYLGLLVPVPVADTIAAIIKLFLAGLGMFLLLRRTGLESLAAAFGALSFSLCSYNVVWLNHPHSAVAATLPWLLLMIHRSFSGSSGRLINSGLLALVVALTIAGGHPDTILKVFFLAGLYFCYLAVAQLVRGNWRAVPGSCAVAGAGLLLGLCLAAAVWLPFYDFLINESITMDQRASAAFGTVTALRDLAVAIIPGLYGSPVAQPDLNTASYVENAMFAGLAPILLAGFALPLAIRNRKGDFLFFAVTGLLLVLAMTGVQPFSWLVRNVPLLQHTSTLRLTLPVQFCIAVSGAMGLQILIQKDVFSQPAWTRLWLIASAAFMIVLMAVASILMIQLPCTAMFALAGFAVPVAVLVSVAGLIPQRPVGSVLLVLLFAELFVAHSGFNPVMKHDDAVLREPPLVSSLKAKAGAGFFRIAAKDHILGPNMPALFQVRDIRGYELPMSRRFTEFMSQAFYGGRWNYGMIYHYCGPEIMEAGNRHLLDILGVRYVLSFTASNDILIAENPGACGHAYFASGISGIRSNLAASVALIKDGACLIEGPVPVQPSGQDGTINVRHENFNGAEFLVESAGTNLIVFNEMPLRGWHAEIDGAPAPSYPVNIVQQGVWVPGGKHVVRFRFAPDSFRNGVMLSIFGAVATMLLLTAGWLRGRKSGGEGGI